jgi:hypothetical protein
LKGENLDPRVNTKWRKIHRNKCHCLSSLPGIIRMRLRHETINGAGKRNQRQYFGPKRHGKVSLGTPKADDIIKVDLREGYEITN